MIFTLPPHPSWSWDLTAGRRAGSTAAKRVTRILRAPKIGSGAGISRAIRKGSLSNFHLISHIFSPTYPCGAPAAEAYRGVGATEQMLPSLSMTGASRIELRAARSTSRRTAPTSDRDQDRYRTSCKPGTVPNFGLSFHASGPILHQLPPPRLSDWGRWTI
jgi:hypothetical protein